MKEGIIPTAIGAALATGTAVLRARDIRERGMQSKNILPMLETAALGFGLAHVVLGTIDLIQNRNS